MSQSATAIIQARMTSTRLPGKVLAEIAGRPMLAWVVQRVRQAATIGNVIVATSICPADDELVAWCAKQSVTCVRGSLEDVLDRFHAAAAKATTPILVRITADCPLIDPDVLDLVVKKLQDDGLDYASNVQPATYPDGLDCEAFTKAALARAWKEATKPSDREHVTPYLRFAEGFRRGNVASDQDLSSHRWTVDDPPDLQFVQAIVKELVSTKEHRFRYRDVVDFLQCRPEIARMQHSAISNEGFLKSLFDQAKAGAAPKRMQAKSQEWLQRSQKVIPGVAQTFSKSTSQYVRGIAPVFLQRGKGCRVWDVDGNCYIDYVQGLLPNILGYAHPEVNAAFSRQLDEGHSFSLPHPLEVELAERLCRIIPCAEKVKFGKNGSDATSGAVRAARYFTGRERVACCGYHGWQDWYIGSTTRHGGVPQAVRELTHPFPYNDLPKLDEILSGHPGQFAAIILEPINFTPPAPGFLSGLQNLAKKHGALLIFDEICTGFHFGLGGAQKRFGVTPDLACFGKAMGNGFPIAAICGRADVMDAFDDIFVSFTFAGEVASMAATLKVLEILEKDDVIGQLERRGKLLQDSFNHLAKLAGLESRLVCTGFPNWSLLGFKDAQGQPCLVTRSLFSQEVCKRGLLQLVTHNLTAAHDEAVIQETLEIYAGTMKTLASWLSDNDPQRHLEGSLIQPVFRVR